jgi:chemotaxis protein methyltransferase CheR
MIADKSHGIDPLQGLSDDVLERLSEFIAANMGLHFPRNRWRDLAQGVSSSARELGFEDLKACMEWILSSPLSKKQVEILAGRLTVGETYFLREKRSLDILMEEILPDMIRTRSGDERRLRIWSAGCSSGEEPFSMAILLQETGAAARDWNPSIIATDINSGALRKAAEGVYGEWSFRGPPRGFREKYFRKTGDGRFEILPHIRKMVSFSYLNLVEDVYPSLLNNTNAMDVIFCRNVLMYFTPDSANKVVNRLYHALVDGGWLIVSPCEASHLRFSQFRAVTFADAVLYRKQGTRAGEQGAVRSCQTISNPLGADIQTAARSHHFPLPCPRPPPPDLRTPNNLPSAPPSPYEEAVALYEQGRYTEAEGRLAVLPTSTPEDVAATVLLCRILANQGKLAEARKLVEKAISVDRLKADLHFLRAMILQEQGALEEATLSLKRALYLDQDMALAHFSLANLAQRQGKGNEARRHFVNTLALLGRYRPDDILPESDGITAGRLTDIIRSLGIGGDRDEEQRTRIR